MEAMTKREYETLRKLLTKFTKVQWIPNGNTETYLSSEGKDVVITVERWVGHAQHDLLGE